MCVNVYSEYGICTGEAASWAVCDQYSNGSVSRASESSGTMFFRTNCSWMLSMPLSTFSLLFSIRSIHLFFSNRPLLTFTGHVSFFSSHKSHLALQSCVFFQPLLAHRDMFFHVLFLSIQIRRNFSEVRDRKCRERAIWRVKICYHPPGLSLRVVGLPQILGSCLQFCLYQGLNTVVSLMESILPFLQYLFILHCPFCIKDWRFKLSKHLADINETKVILQQNDSIVILFRVAPD